MGADLKCVTTDRPVIGPARGRHYTAAKSGAYPAAGLARRRARHKKDAPGRTAKVMAATDTPATFGASSHGLRGDYRAMKPDYTVEQDYAAYSPEAQERWRRLYQRQMRLVPGRACDEFLRVVDTL